MTPNTGLNKNLILFIEVLFNERVFGNKEINNKKNSLK